MFITTILHQQQLNQLYDEHIYFQLLNYLIKLFLRYFVNKLYLFFNNDTIE